METIIGDVWHTLTMILLAIACVTCMGGVVAKIIRDKYDDFWPNQHPPGASTRGRPKGPTIHIHFSKDGDIDVLLSSEEKLPEAKETAQPVTASPAEPLRSDAKRLLSQTGGRIDEHSENHRSGR